MATGNNQQGVVSTIVHRAPWWIPWLFLFVMFLGFATYQFTAAHNTQQATIEARTMIRDVSIAGCERDNELRAETNVQTEVLKDVLRTAADSALSRGQTEVAALYLEHMNNIQPLDMTDCEAAYPEEMQQAGFLANP